MAACLPELVSAVPLLLSSVDDMAGERVVPSRTKLMGEESVLSQGRMGSEGRDAGGKGRNSSVFQGIGPNWKCWAVGVLRRRGRAVKGCAGQHGLECERERGASMEGGTRAQVYKKREPKGGHYHLGSLSA